MTHIQHIGEQLWAGSQPSPEDITKLAAQGVKSIINLRFPEESGVLTNEQELSKANDLQYINLPLASNASNEEKVDPLLTAIADLPTPIYFHCGGGGRAAVTALIALAVQENWGKEAIEVKAIESGIDPAHPQIHHYLTKLKQSSEAD
ncbi:MAG: fused DSP-PTPase phosphatase/NAD kinase-like protein [Synechococcales cyanobacterium]